MASLQVKHQLQRCVTAIHLQLMQAHHVWLWCEEPLREEEEKPQVSRGRAGAGTREREVTEGPGFPAPIPTLLTWADGNWWLFKLNSF